MTLISIEVERCERFINAYNAIDKFIRQELDIGRDESFTSSLRKYNENRPLTTKQYNKLRDYADLRNVIIHERSKDNGYLSVPVESVVLEIERIHDSLLNPLTVIPRYQANVINLDEQDSLKSVLSLIKSNDFSQFPVFSNTSQFVGLLTENGIARWVAFHALDETTIIEFEDHTVADALKVQENSANYHFISRNTSLLAAINKFMKSPELEAILITQSGRASESLLGIMTRYDVIQALQETMF